MRPAQINNNNNKTTNFTWVMSKMTCNNRMSVLFSVIRTFRRKFPLFKNVVWWKSFSYEVEMALQWHMQNSSFIPHCQNLVDASTARTTSTVFRLAAGRFLNYARFQVLTALLKKTQIVKNVTACRMVNSDQRFREVYYLHLRCKEAQEFGDKLARLVLGQHTENWPTYFKYPNTLIKMAITISKIWHKNQ